MPEMDLMLITAKILKSRREFKKNNPGPISIEKIPYENINEMMGAIAAIEQQQQYVEPYTESRALAEYRISNAMREKLNSNGGTSDEQRLDLYRSPSVQPGQ